MARKQQALSPTDNGTGEELPCIALGDSPLDKIIFPSVAIHRAMDEDGIPLRLKKSKLAFDVGGSLQSHEDAEKGHSYAVMKLTLKAMATEMQSGAEMVSVALTCLGYFRCDKAHDQDAVNSYLDGNHEEFARRGVDKIYPAAVLEFDRLVRQTGLPSMNLSPSPPSKIQVQLERIAAKAPQKSARKRSPAVKKATASS
jgi:hypothetical protein